MANRHWVGGTANWDNTAGTKWATTSGGVGGAAVPTASDDVYFDANSGAVTISLGIAIASCAAFNCTGFIGTFAMGTNRLNMVGDFTVNSTMLLTGTSSNGITISTLSTVTTGGHIFQVILTFGSTGTYTLADNLRTNSRIRVGDAATINGNQINLLTNAQFVVVTNNGTCSGSTTIVITGGNTSIGADTTILNTSINLNITINSSGTVTFRQDSNANGGAFGFGNKTMTYLAGTVVFNCAYIRLTQAGTVTFLLGSVILPGLRVAVSSVTIVPTQDININGTLQLTSLSQIAAGNIYATTLLMSGVMTASAGVLTLNGTGSWSGAFDFRNNLIINTAGVLTISGSVIYGTGTLTYTAGTVITTGNTLNLTTCTLNTNGISWNNITLSTTTTLTINSLLTATGTMTLPNANVTFSGTSGFTVGIFIIGTTLTAARTISFLSNAIYTIASDFTITTSGNTFRALFVASTPGTKAILTLNYGATQNVGFTNATDINSNNGQTIYSFNGVVTTTFNWQTLTYPRQTSYVFGH